MAEENNVIDVQPKDVAPDVNPVAANPIPEIKKERVVNIIGMGRGALDRPDTGENWGMNEAQLLYGEMDKLFFMDGFDFCASKDRHLKSVLGMGFKESVLKYPNTMLISKYQQCVAIDKDTLEPIPAMFMGKDENGHNKFQINCVPDQGVLLNAANQPVLVNPFPLDEAVKLSGGCFFTSTIAYVLAFAILEKVDRIRLYGFEVWSGSEANEYSYQRPCVDYWLAFARGRGIKVEVPWYLLHTVKNEQNLYGYNDQDNKPTR